MTRIRRGHDPRFDAIEASRLGWGQTWQDMSASRAADVVYTNTTGRPIVVSMQVIGTTFAGNMVNADLFVDGVNVEKCYRESLGTNVIVGVIQGIVPDGSTYEFQAIENADAGGWRELR